jgi:uncharacterized protein
LRVILIHGNGNSKPTDNWLPYLKKELENLSLKVEAPQFPDAELARSSYWLPFLGSALIGTYYTDLGMETEKLSGYFDAPWKWENIKRNQKWIIQFAGANDPWIPLKEAHVVRDHLNTDYYESPDQGHFGGDYYKETFPELLAALKKKINLSN